MDLLHIYRQRRVTLILPGQTGPTESDLIPGDGNHAAPLVSADDIRLRAYLKWESAGKPPGDGVPFWLEAERELVDEHHSGPVTDNPSGILSKYPRPEGVALGRPPEGAGTWGKPR